MSVEYLLSKQNRDGGWPYARGVSWTEPTAYAVLALLDAGEREGAMRGLRWLRTTQRSDGGWGPQAGVDQSTWVTALAALIPPEHLGEPAHTNAVRWVGVQTGEESTMAFRFREWLLGNPPSAEQLSPGWPWVPGTAAWVGPTSFAILALEKDCGRRARPDLQKRISAGRRFLLNRTCEGGGWNHGSVRPLGYESKPYPETTGLALAALRGVRSPKVDVSIALARQYLSECRSADAFNWLRLGLAVQDQLPAEYCAPTKMEFRRLTETSLNLLVSAAVQGRNVFLA